VRDSWRLIRRRPGLTAVVVLSLGVGIGVNTTIFTWIQALVFHPIPGVRDAAAFHFVEPRTETGAYPGVSWPEFRDLGERMHTFRQLIAFRPVPLNVGDESRTERTFALLVSGNYFSGLGLQPARGRFIGAGETARPGGEPVVVISHGFWRSRLGGIADPIGHAIRVNGRELTIIGVAPDRFQGTVIGLNFDLWVPATLAPVLLNGSRELDDRSMSDYWVIGQPVTTRASAQAELDVAMRELARLYPKTNAGLQGEVIPFWRAPRGAPKFLLPAVELLQGLMLLVLVAVCGNAANLMLTRASARQREIGVHLALGAGPWRIARLLLTENLILALMGAGLGALIAMWGTERLRDVPFTAAFPIRFQTGVDASALGVTALLAILCGLIVGAAPAWQLARVDPHRALRNGYRATGRRGIRSVLMGAQVALALVVLIVATLFFQSVRGTRDIDPGFQRDGLLLAQYDLTGRNDDAASSRAFASRLLERLRALPDVGAAAIALSVPLDIHGLPMRAFAVEGRPRTDGGSDQAASNTVTPGYFETMGIPIRSGRDFADLNDTTAPPEVMVNEEFVKEFIETGEPLGRRVDVRGRMYSIVGVVRNSLSNAFGEPPTAAIYFSYRDRPSSNGEIHLRARAGADAENGLSPEVQRTVRAIDPTLPVYNVRSMSEHIEKNLVLRRIPARMFTALGPLLLLLAAIGIYAVVGFVVAQRTSEIGVRLALGATPRRVTAETMRDALRVIGVGALTGWLLAFIIYLHIRASAGMGGPAFVGAPAVLLAVAALACWMPARRAATVDPAVTLRES
jgi:putative ABC transport system permease protein